MQSAGTWLRWLLGRSCTSELLIYLDTGNDIFMATVEQSIVRFPEVVIDRPDRHKLVGRLGPWHLLHQLGNGDLTRVYLARPAESSGEQAAAYIVKLLRKEWWRDPQAIARQRRESWIGERVSHPNVVPVLSVGVEGPPFYVVMPRLEGSTLRSLLDDGFVPPVPVALWIVRQAAEGLAAIYDKTRMIHGDIKPANIFVSPSGHATLIDFGFARTAQESSTWADRPLIGTLNYIAPEMLTSALAADVRSDFYSLGVTLFEMLTGRLPLESNDPGELALRHREEKPTCILKLRSDLPQPVASLVHTLLSKDAIRRPSSHRELIDRLVRLEIEFFDIRCGS